MVSELQKKKYRIKEKEEYPNRQAHQADLSVVELVPIRIIHHHCTFQGLTLKNHLLFVHHLNLLNNLNFVLKEIPVTKKNKKNWSIHSKNSVFVLPTGKLCLAMRIFVYSITHYFAYDKFCAFSDKNVSQFFFPDTA